MGVTHARAVVIKGEAREIPTASEEFTLGIDGVDVPVKTDATYYSVGTLEMLGTVAAKITALITLHAQANTSAQKRTRLDFQSCLI